MVELQIQEDLLIDIIFGMEQEIAWTLYYQFANPCPLKFNILVSDFVSYSKQVRSSKGISVCR
jgi:hypothetical protein